MAADTTDKLRQAQALGLISPKRLQLARSKANNEPLLSLTYLRQFLTDLHQATKGETKKVINPAPAVIKIITNRDLGRVEYEFELTGIKQEDLANIQTNPLAHLEAHLYPEDVINIVAYSRAWIRNQFKEVKEIHWQLGAQTLQNEWRQALESGSKTQLAVFVRTDLREALTELLELASEIIQQQSPTTQALDQINDILDRISRDLTASTPQPIIQLWESLLQPLSRALAAAQLQQGSQPADTSLVIPNKTISIHHAREILTHFYETIETQLRTSPSPWDRFEHTPAGKKIVARFASLKPQLTSTKLAIPANQAVDGVDLNLGRLALEFYEQFFALLAQKTPPEAEEEAPAEEPEDTEGGEAEEEEPQLPELLTPDKLLEQIVQQLPLAAWPVAREILATENDLEQLSPAQLELLKQAVIALVTTRLDQKQLATELEQRLTPEQFDPETKRYLITPKWRQEFLAQLAQAQVATLKSELAQLYTQISQTTLEAEVPPTLPGAVVPPGLTPTPTSTPTPPAPSSSEAVQQRAKYIQETATGLLSLYFLAESPDGFKLQELNPQLRAAVVKFLTQELADLEPSALTPNLRAQLYQKLLLDPDFFNLVLEFYEQQLQQLQLPTSARLNLEHTIDVFFQLTADPGKLITQLDEQELRQYLNLGVKQVSLVQLRRILLLLIKIRRTHFRLHHPQVTIKPVFAKQNILTTTKGKIKLHRAAHQFVGPMRELVDATADHDDAGMVAFNLTPNDINRLNVTKGRKRLLTFVHRQIWQQLAAELSQTEIEVVYHTFSLTPPDAEAKLGPTTPPPDLSMAGLLQAINGGRLNLPGLMAGDEKKKDRLLSKANRAIAKAALSLFGPEVTGALEAVEKIPIIGEKIKKLEEKLGQAIVIAGALITALIAWLTKSILTAIMAIGGGVAGAFIGSAIMPGVGTAIGAGIGTVAGGALGNFISQGGGAKGSLAGWGGKLGLSAPTTTTQVGVVSKGAGLLKGVGIATTTVATAVGVTTYTNNVNLINSIGAQQKPIKNTTQVSSVGLSSNPNISKYVELEKTADTTKIGKGQTQTITYTITIAPKNGYSINVNKDTSGDEWLYLGGDSLSLPDQTQKILDQIGEEPITAPLTITYSAEMGGEDVAVNNNFTLNFAVVDAAGAIIDTDTVSASEMIMIGNPKIGCLQPGAAGKTLQSGNFIRISQTWNPNVWNKILQLFANHAGKSAYLSGWLCKGGPVNIYRLKNNGTYGGWYYGLNPSPTLGLYNYALGWTTELEYTLVHELGHIIDNLNPDLKIGELWYLYGHKEENKCFGYPPVAKTKNMKYCNKAEAFAEAFTLYVAKPSNHKGLETYDPDVYDWFKKNIFHGEEF